MLCVQFICQREEKVRHEINGYAEYDSRYGTCVKYVDIPRLSRRLYSEFCVYDHAIVKFREADELVTVLTGRGVWCEYFCLVVPRNGQRLTELEKFLAVMRARYPSLQVSSDNEETLKRVLTAACKRTNLEYRNTCLATPAFDGRSDNSVKAMKEMVRLQKESVNAMGIPFSVKDPLFDLLVRHSEWTLNYLVRSDSPIETDNRVIETSPYESHTGNPVPRSTNLLYRILVGRRESDDKTAAVSANLVSGSYWRLRSGDCFASRRSAASS